MTTFPVQGLLLQSNMDADGWGIDNLDVSSLGLVKADVGLGNVDNTADADKPLSAASIAALALKEDLITAGTTSQFYRGDKTFVNYGALALQDGNTTLPLLGVIGALPSTTASIKANRSDSIAFVQIEQFGTTVLGNVITGVPAANTGLVSFENASWGIIRTFNPLGGGIAPLIFATNNLRRMRLAQGLNVGGDTDPGSGCITAFDTISAGKLVGDGSGITGLVKNQIPVDLNASTMPSLQIIGPSGTGYIGFTHGSWGPPPPPGPDAPAFNTAVYANALGRIAFRCADSNFDPSFSTALLSANRIYQWPNQAGVIAVGAVDSGWTAWTGSGSKATKVVGSATNTENSAAIKQIIDALLTWGILST